MRRSFLALRIAVSAVVVSVAAIAGACVADDAPVRASEEVDRGPRPQGDAGPTRLTVTEGARVGQPQSELAAGRVRLWVSNQSFEDDPVNIVVSIDGETVVDDAFAVEGQHNWRAFDIGGLTAGTHVLMADSGTGAGHETTFVVPDDERRWLVVDYWYYPEDQNGRFFTVSEHDKPVAFA